MWNKLSTTDFFIKFVTSAECYEVLVTNFVTIWSAMYSQEQFLLRIQESNPRFEKIENSIIEQAKQMLQCPENTSHIETQTTQFETMKINLMMTSSYGYPICLRMELKKGCEQLFFQKVTQSLFRVVKDLTDSTNELYEIMAKKDREIVAYKLEGGRLGLKYLKTPAFDRDEHMSKHPACTRMFGSNQIPDAILERQTECTNAVTVKEEISPLNSLKEGSVEVNFKRERVKQETRTSTDSPTHTHLESVTTDTSIKEEIVKNEGVTPKKKLKFLNM